MSLSYPPQPTPMQPFSDSSIAEQLHDRKELDDLYPSAQHFCLQLCKQQGEGEIDCDEMEKQYAIEKADDLFGHVPQAPWYAIDYYVEEYVGDINPFFVAVGVFLVCLVLTALAFFGMKDGSRRGRGRRGGVSKRERGVSKRGMRRGEEEREEERE
ncbi:MAG: hypothetical protein Q9221_005493 [Calogaya cf. arnoldii]